MPRLTLSIVLSLLACLAGTVAIVVLFIVFVGFGVNELKGGPTIAYRASLLFILPVAECAIVAALSWSWVRQGLSSSGAMWRVSATVWGCVVANLVLLLSWGVY